MEKFYAVLSSIGMILPIVTSATKLLTKEKKKSTAASVESTIVETVEAGTKEVLAGKTTSLSVAETILKSIRENSIWVGLAVAAAAAALVISIAK
jgi:hypothetical protein